MKIISPHEQHLMHSNHPGGRTTKKLWLILFRTHESILSYYFSLFRQSRPASPHGPLFKDLIPTEQTFQGISLCTLHPMVAQAVKSGNQAPTV